MKNTIKINNDALRIRPSAIESFYSCSYAWGKTFLEGVYGPSNNRAAIGTAIHAGVEAMWNSSISSGKKDLNLTMMQDAAIDSWQEQNKEGITFGSESEDINTGAMEICKGTEAFLEDIVPFTAIPQAVEEFYKIDIDHPIVSELGGTVDYIGNGIIADVKTSKRKSGPEGHSVQQSTYKYLAEQNGVEVNNNLIQQVVLTKNPSGAILELEPDVHQAKFLINGMLDVLELVAKDTVPIEMLLRPNTKHMFCSKKFCVHYNDCPAVKGNLVPAQPKRMVKI